MGRRSGKVVRKKKRTVRHNGTRKATVLNTVYRKGKEAARGMSVAAIISLLFLIIASVFLMYQWKEFKIRQTLEEITALKMEISRLRTEIIRKEGYIKRELMNYNRVSRIAFKAKGLKQSVQSPTALIVDKSTWHHWLEKDEAQEN